MHICVTCGSRILDDPTASECAVCRVNGPANGDEKFHAHSDRVERAESVGSTDQGTAVVRTWVLAWFVAGAIWYLFDAAEVTGDRDDWLAWVDPLRPDTWLELGVKTLGVILAGPIVLSRFMSAVAPFMQKLMKQVAIAAAVLVAVIVVVNPGARAKVGQIGSDFVDLFRDEARDDSAFSSKDWPSVVQLRQQVLGLINTDRALHGVDPVALGTNAAAQDHANDMLVFGYLGHWWVDGKKPYMAYSQAGGTSYVAENVAVAGHHVAGLATNDCSSFFSLCEQLIPDEQLAELQNRMVYDDADSNWGHRETMLDPGHSEVSIGIAFDEEFISLVQHFSGGSARIVEGPAFTDTQLSMKVEILDNAVQVFKAVTIWWEPLPTPRNPMEISALRSYCVGGDFTAKCGDPIFVVVPPPPVGQIYHGLTKDHIVADAWTVDSGLLEIRATMPKSAMRTGMYTVSVFAGEGSDHSDQLLVQLTTRYLE